MTTAASQPLRPSKISDRCELFDPGSPLSMSNFRPLRTFRPQEARLDVEFPTSADFSSTPVLGM